MFPTPIQKTSLKVNITYRVLLIITLILWLLPLIAVMMTSVRTGADILKGNYWTIPTEFAILKDVLTIDDLGYK